MLGLVLLPTLLCFLHRVVGILEEFGDNRLNVFSHVSSLSQCGAITNRKGNIQTTCQSLCQQCFSCEKKLRGIMTAAWIYFGQTHLCVQDRILCECQRSCSWIWGILIADIVDRTLTWAGGAEQYDVTLLQFNVVLCGVKHLAAPPLLRRLLARLLLHRRSQSVSVRADPGNLQQLCKVAQMQGVTAVTEQWELCHTQPNYFSLDCRTIAVGH